MAAKPLYCASCGRVNSDGENGVSTVTYKGVVWCESCAAIGRTPDGEKYVSMPSPGQMYEENTNDPIDAWIDCYQYKPKKRILVKKAKSEIQREWRLWKGDKSNDMSMFLFFGWLKKHRPYFLTFRSKSSPWQTVHTWLRQYEGKGKRESSNGT